MSHTSLNVSNAPIDVAYLQALVPVMRELGVTSFGTVTLGPAKAAEAPGPDDDERKQLAEKQAVEREKRMRYGASGGPVPLGPFDR